MSEKPEEAFDDEEDDDVADGDTGLDLDDIIRDLEGGKRRRNAKPSGEPAWRKLERFLEDRRTSELLSDFDDYEIGDEADERPARAATQRKGRRKS